MLLNTPEIHRIESRFLSLFERTFLKGIKGKTAPSYLKSVNTQFKSKTFQVQADKIIDDIYLQSIKYTDKQAKKANSASVTKKSNQNKNNLNEGILYYHRLAASVSKPLPITEEAVRQASGLAKEITESIVKILKDDGIYLEHPDKLEKRVRDLWGGQKYRAVRFARTFTADVATNTELWRYQDAGIDDLQFYAKIDDRTSDQCRTMHGTVFKTDSPEARRFRCPLHQNCRSSLLPVPITQKVGPKMRFENRDFTKQMDQEFNVLDDRVDKDLIKKTFSDIDTFNEKYRINQFILDEDLEGRLQKLNVQVLSELPEKEPGLKYTRAKTAKEAETWVIDNTSVKYADFKGVDIEIVNEMNERLAYHLNLAPEISEKMKFYGTGQAQFELWYQHELTNKVELLRKLYPGEDDKQLLKRAKIVVKKPKMAGYAHAWNHPKFGGIGVNKKYGEDLLEFSKYLDSDVASGFHPIGCNTPKSVFDHEFGHVLDYVYKVSDSSTIIDLYDKLLKDQEFTKSISRYASTNKKELVAEAWAEYLNNPEPRAVSKQIGELIMSKVKEGQT